jgi:hypothetical protein
LYLTEFLSSLANARDHRLQVDEWITVPQPQQRTPEVSVDFKKNPAVAKLAVTDLKLTWKATAPKGGTASAVVTLKGVNNRNDDEYFSSIKLTFTSGMRAESLFTTTTFSIKGASPPASKPPNTSASDSGSAKEPVVTTQTVDTQASLVTNPSQGLSSTANTSATPQAAQSGDPKSSSETGVTTTTHSVETHTTSTASGPVPGKGRLAAVGDALKDLVGLKKTETDTTDSGLVDALQSPDVPKVKFAVNKVNSVKGITKWEITISNGAGGSLKLPKGAWLQVEITGDLNANNTYKVTIDESFTDSEGKGNGHFPKPVDVIVP